MSFERWEQFVRETAQQLEREPKKQKDGCRISSRKKRVKTWTKEQRNFDGPIKENGTERTKIK